ncbi:MAG TPA: helix-turn-helix domain-containing protein [Candidatus Omnitrophota bacterium]|nr:helix-turn-helix domain-containing protein [Candidatus Omnitrophota bacterium]
MEIARSDKTYLSVDEVAKRFCVNPTTIYRLAQRRVIPGFKIGSQWRFSQEMLDVWVSHRVNSKKLNSARGGQENHDTRTGKK